MERIRMGPIGQRECYQTEWNETAYNVISHINVSYDKIGITSIQFGYVQNGGLVMSKTYGSSSEVCSRRILRLNHESEFVTGISGELYHDCISSLTIHTNQRTHVAVHLTFDSGKVRPEKMEFHSGILNRREFRGFFGSHDGDHLNSIGFYVTLVLPDVTTMTDVKTIKNEKV